MTRAALLLLAAGFAGNALGADASQGIEDLLAAACNDAVRKIEAKTAEKYSGLMSGMNLPPGMKLPF